MTEETRKFPILAYAGFWRRLAAYLIDLILISMLQFTLFGSWFNPLFDSGSIGMKILVALVRLVIHLLYFILTTYFFKGQSIGKLFLGLELVSLVEEDLSLTTIIVRESFVRIALIAFPIIGIFPAWMERKQQLMDLVTKTAVIDRRRLSQLNSLEYA